MKRPRKISTTEKIEEKIEKLDPTVKVILALLGAGVILTAALLFPGLGYLYKVYQKAKFEQDKKKWEKFNSWRLRQIIKRLQKQKVVEIKNGIVQITERGKKKLLKFNLEEMSLTKKRDGKWRLVIYDVSNLRNEQRFLFRSMLKRLKFLQLQRSVYLTPFVCENEIEYLRQLFTIGNEVVILKVSGIENEQTYKNYFGI